MASVGGLIGGYGSSLPSSSSSSSWSQMKGNKKNNNNNKFRVACISSSSAAVSDPYRTLRIPRGASESEVKKAFRQLALKVLIYLLFCLCPLVCFWSGNGEGGFVYIYIYS